MGEGQSTSAVLRQSLTTLGRINYLYQNPSKLNDLKRLELENKWHISDLELIKVLKKKGILRDDEIYRKLCNSTHMNLRWHKFAKHAKSCGTINENAIGEVFGIILTAQEFALCSSNLLSDMLEKQFSVRMETEALNQLGMRWQENYEHFKLKYLKD